MFGRSHPSSTGAEEPAPPLAPAGWGGVSGGYEKPAALFSVRRLFVGAGVVALAIAGLLAVAQWLPGVPARWRPWGRVKLWQAERLFERAIEAERAGDAETARIAYMSALAARPDAPAPRWRLGRNLGAAGKFDEAVSVLAPVTADPPAFVHDTLLDAGDYPGLARFALAGLRHETGRRGVWIGSLRLALGRCGKDELAVVAEEIARAAATAKPNEAAWLLAIRGEALGEREESARALRALEASGSLDAAETLLGLELWLRAGRTSDAWVWVQRHRAGLGSFDAWFADWRLALVMEPVVAERDLRALSPAALDASRWQRLAAAILMEGRGEMSEALGRLAEAKAPPAPACLSVWAVAMSLGQETAAQEWGERFQRAGGRELPLLLGRALRSADEAERWRAALLIAAGHGLPREILSAVALRR